MELLFFIFIGFILLVIIISGSSETKKLEKKDYTENFKMYFYSIPEVSRKKFINNLDYIHKLQFEDFMKSDDVSIPEFFIKQFNAWTQNENGEVQPFDLNNGKKSKSDSYDDNLFNDCNFRNDGIDTTTAAENVRDNANCSGSNENNL